MIEFGPRHQDDAAGVDADVASIVEDFHSRGVTDETLLLYLMTHLTLKEGTSFGEHLHLPYLVPYIRELYDTFNEVPALSDENREAIKANLDKLKEAYEGVGSEEFALIENLIHDTAPAERGLFIYLNRATSTIEASQIQHGELSQVVTTFSFEDPSLIPLMCAHTHDPNDSLFSIQDFEALLTRQGEYRTMNAELLVCKSFQLIALAGPGTPMLDAGAAKGHITQCKSDLSEAIEAELNELILRYDRLMVAANDYRIRGFAHIHDRLKELDDQHKAGTITLVEVKTILDELGVEVRLKISHALDLAHRTQVRIYERFQRMLFDLTLQFIRTHDIQIYVSRDGENFHLFEGVLENFLTMLSQIQTADLSARQ